MLGEVQADVGLKAKLFRGLGDRSRLSILESLADVPKNVSALVEETGLTQPNVSMHLDCLFCCGLVTRERRGRFVYYEVKSRRTKQLLVAAERALADAAEQIAMCEKYKD